MTAPLASSAVRDGCALFEVRVASRRCTARPARNPAQVKAGGELPIGGRTGVFADCDGEFAKARQLHGGKGGVKVLL